MAVRDSSPCLVLASPFALPVSQDRERACKPDCLLHAKRQEATPDVTHATTATTATTVTTATTATTASTTAASTAPVAEEESGAPEEDWDEVEAL
jgi:hypothetical protein